MQNVHDWDYKRHDFFFFSFLFFFFLSLHIQTRLRLILHFLPFTFLVALLPFSTPLCPSSLSLHTFWSPPRVYVTCRGKDRSLTLAFLPVTCHLGVHQFPCPVIYLSICIPFLPFVYPFFRPPPLPPTYFLFHTSCSMPTLPCLFPFLIFFHPDFPLILSFHLLYSLLYSSFLIYLPPFSVFLHTLLPSLSFH